MVGELERDRRAQSRHQTMRYVEIIEEAAEAMDDLNSALEWVAKFSALSLGRR